MGRVRAMETVTAMEMAMVTALIMTLKQMPSTADADIMVVCVVCVLCEFWRESLPPREGKCPPSH
jgi:hypothetical protein